MTPEDTATVIADELLQIHRESWGAGAQTAKAYVLDDAVVCFLDGLELLPNEQFLIGQGNAELVLDVRRTYQDVVGASFKAAVERATGRRVVHFTSDTSIEPAFSVEIFRLG
jgi:uncharacterized protein YbcI